jgi:hypothetical protein
MNTKSLTVLGGAAVVVALLAIVTLRRRESAVEASPAGGKLFPELTARINDAASIEIKRKDGVTTLSKSGEIWGLAEKRGYPVDMAAVRKCLIGMSQMTTAEEKTADPALYAKLGVEDPAAEGSTSALVTVRDAGGGTLAALIVGKERTGKSYAGARQVYVRKPDEARSWLANGELGLHEGSADWLDKKILEIKRDRVRAVEVLPAEGEAVLVDRDKPETNDFTLHDIPEGKELTYPSAPSSLGSALEWLNLEDVVPAGEVDVKDGAAATTKFSCFDGLTVTVTTKNVGEKTYARFEASYEPPPASSGPPAPTESVDPAKPEGEAGDAAQEAKPETKTREEVEKEAAELNARLGAWTFVIPSYNKTSFQKAKSELLKDAAPPPEAPPESSAPPDAEPPQDASPPEETKPDEPTPPQEEKPSDPGTEPKPPGSGAR